MTGAGLLGLILLSMAWLFFLGGTVSNYQVLWLSIRKSETTTESKTGTDTPGNGKNLPPRLGFAPGVTGSLAAFFSIPALAKYGVAVPWPWLWILLPLAVDPYCLPALLVMAYRKLRPSPP